MRETVLTVFSAAMGAVIGSFLNACIHRMPRNISLGNPKRSFCPSCQRLIPWYENLPLLSWLALRGKCSGCGSRISVRYFLVELLTAAIFLALWLSHGLPLAPIYWLFAALLITATFIDIEHFIIPDEITWGGTAAGILLSVAVPALMFTSSRLEALGLSVAGAALGYGLLWLIVEGGKLAFGKLRHVFPEPVAFAIGQEGEQIMLSVSDDKLPWEEIFSREKDQIVMKCEKARIVFSAPKTLPATDSVPSAEASASQERVVENTTLRFYHNRLVLDDGEISLEQIDSVEGTLHMITIPREAMGFGDVKFIACIGAFLGWKAVLFTICAASIIGCVAALAGIFIARDRAGSRVPFGPFLALGGAIWMFGGDRLWDWYFGILRYGDGGVGF
jgi:leader peptidase (prepilin peptidase)/N-methyltransferase